MRKLLLPALVMCSCGVFYKLSLQTEGAGTLSAASSKRGHLDDFDAFEVAKLTATPDSGWTVANWQGTDDDTSLAETNTKTFGTANADVKVTFIPADTTLYLLSLGASQDGTLTASPVGPHYAAGAMVALTATPNPGFRLGQWAGTDDDNSVLATNSVTMNNHRMVSVMFAPIDSLDTFTLMLGTPAHGSLMAAAGPFAAGSVVTVTATADPGYHVASWVGSDNDASTATSNVVTMNANKGVSAIFAPNLYTITLQAGAGGTLSASPTGPLHEFASMVGFTAVPAVGFRVASWSNTDNDSSTSSSNSLVVQGDTTVGVTFEPIPLYTLSIDPTPNGTVTTSETGTQFYEGTVVHLIGTPDSSGAGAPNELTSWSGTDNDASTATMNTVTMNADKLVSATFASICLGTKTFLLVYSVGHGTGAISLDAGPLPLPPDDRFPACTVVNVTASATVGNGSYFSAWLGTAEQSTNTDPGLGTKTDTVNMYSDRIIEARFLP